jgi:rhodanese-related sulfurtransferase
MKIETTAESFKKKILSSIAPIGSIETMEPIEFKILSCEEIQEVLSINGILIDVRTPKEFNSVRLFNARNIPLMHIIKTLETTERNIPVLLYSNNGTRSEAAKKKLLAVGFSNVTNIGELKSYPFCS